jgi:selenocysteine-specific elongation factor
VDPQPQVVATAGHVDHGKSALIQRLTGMDPDRFAEEKRRGLTIDLGYAWCSLPSGREVGFVDVPGHERFIRNMLAGVGPVRLVLFVVAADEGWKPQSEEHLAILDVLGAAGAVVALTKADLVDVETLDIAEEETRDRLRGTALEKAEIVRCSSVTGAGINDLLAALDRMLEAAPEPEREGRPRQFIDRVFSIRGAGTVVTGTLTGGALEVGREVELYPTGRRARIRGLQNHKRSIDMALPVARVAANLVGIERGDLDRGDVLGVPGQWRPTSVIDAQVMPIRGLTHPLTARGSYKLYAGAAERDVRVRFLDQAPDTERESPSTRRFARIRLSSPLVLDVHDRFVLREAGRRETVAGGIVLDTGPPQRPGADAPDRLAARATASRDELPTLLIGERGAVRGRDVTSLTGAAPVEIPGAVRSGPWWITVDLHRAVEASVLAALGAHHREHPLDEGADLSLARDAAAEALEGRGRTVDQSLIDAIVETLAEQGQVVRTASEIRLASHRVALEGRSDEVDRLVGAIASAEPTPPTVAELVAAGHDREVIEAAARQGTIVRVSPQLVVTRALIERAEAVLRASGAAGITVSAFREAVGTSRKYAVPMLEYFDQRGVTLRKGDLRVVRS